MSPIWLTAPGCTIPLDLVRAFAPATHCLYEWTDYYLKFPGADQLQVGSEWLEPVDAGSGLFRLRFENQLGLARLQPYAGPQPLGAPLTVEVISPKFPAPAQHAQFYRALLDDLFARAARLPFTLSAPTSRNVTEARRPSTPLFAYHFLCQYAAALRAALQIVIATPHRLLTDQLTWVNLPEVTEADADVLIEILHHPNEWQRARGFPLTERLHGHAPARVWQRRSADTFDTPENRFVLAFTRELLIAADQLPAQAWWNNVPAERQSAVLSLTHFLRQALTEPLFGEVGPLRHFSSASQVLQCRAGYRELLELWHVFQRARRPLFAALRHALEVRDVAQLYEMWVFFALAEEIGLMFHETPMLDLASSDAQGVAWGAQARYGMRGALHYNRTFRSPNSYSVPLRPDFTWEPAGGAKKVALDAKFRLERQTLSDTDEDSPGTTARRADLYKMHTYRDALHVRAAIALYPGNESVFYDASLVRRPDFTLNELLTTPCTGIGAIALSPGTL